MSAFFFWSYGPVVFSKNVTKDKHLRLVHQRDFKKYPRGSVSQYSGQCILGHNDKAVHILNYKTLTQEWIWFHEIIHGLQHLGNKTSKYAASLQWNFLFESTVTKREWFIWS